MDLEGDIPDVPEPEVFFKESPLYTVYRIGIYFPHGEPPHYRPLQAFLGSDARLGWYCVECQNDAVFRHEDFHEVKGSERGIYAKILKCAWDDSHSIVLICQVKAIAGKNENGLYIETEYIRKIGQIPSLSDLAEHEVRKYRGPLGRKCANEFAKAIRLAASGIGVGSYAYLRRIFESLVEGAQKGALTTDGWDDALYDPKAGMEERIEVLKDHLPETLVQNKTMYGILSKGLHELDEDECLRYYPVLKAGIELILTEKITEKQQKKAKGALRGAVSKITGDLKSR